MTGVTVEADFDVAARALGRLTDEQIERLTDEIAEMILTQTKQHIEVEKTAPDGDAWAPWSERYAETRKPHHSLLVDRGNPGLLESIQNYTTGLAAVVGTNLVYGAIHQFGAEDGTLPARPWLGLSAGNRLEIEDLVVGKIEELLQ